MKIQSILVAALLVLGAQGLSAQIRYQAGATFGSNYSSLSSDLFTTSSGRMSFAAGCSFIVGFGNHFELNQEILFVQKGANAQAVYFLPEQQPLQMTYAYHYNSFEAGLLAGYSPWRDIPMTFQAGGFFGTHVHNLDRSAREVYIGDYERLNDAMLAIDLNDAFSGIDAGPVVGISAGKGRMRVNARYYYGMRNLYNNLDFVEKGHRLNTSALRLTVSYFLK